MATKYLLELANKKQFTLLPGDILIDARDERNGRAHLRVALPKNKNNIFAGKIVRTFAANYVVKLEKIRYKRGGINE